MNGRILHHVMALVVKVLKHRVDLVVTHQAHVEDRNVMVPVFNL